MADSWVYFLGHTEGKNIKIGYTGRDDIAERLNEINRDHLDGSQYVLLAALYGASRTNETAVKNHFAKWELDAGRKREYFEPVDELAEYVNWLRQQWWTTVELGDPARHAVDFDRWMPTGDRRVGTPPDDPDVLIQPWRVFHGDLAGTPWDWLSTPLQIGEDYYTPTEYIDAAREAMGGIDLDPASHFQANRRHRIPTYYHLQRSAFDNPWFGRVWLNPPYGDNAPWFDRFLEFWNAGEIEQFCMISPVWVFTTRIARPVVDAASRLVLLTPTPEFWGHPSGKTGTNHPHAILYAGKRGDKFVSAFARFGIPIELLNIPTDLKAAA